MDHPVKPDDDTKANRMMTKRRGHSLTHHLSFPGLTRESKFLDHPVKPDDDTKVNWIMTLKPIDRHCPTSGFLLTRGMNSI